MEDCISTLPIFGFSNSTYDLNFIKSHRRPSLFNEKKLESRVIKKTSNFISSKFGNVQMLDIPNFICGAATPDSYLKAYETSESKGFFPLNSSSVHRNLITKNYHHKKLFPTSFETTILWKLIITDLKTYFSVVTPNMIPWQKWKNQMLLSQEQKTMNIWKRSGVQKTWVHSKVSSSNRTTRKLFRHLNICRKSFIVSAK